MEFGGISQNALQTANSNAVARNSHDETVMRKWGYERLKGKAYIVLILLSPVPGTEADPKYFGRETVWKNEWLHELSGLFRVTEQLMVDWNPDSLTPYPSPGFSALDTSNSWVH